MPPFLGADRYAGPIKLFDLQDLDRTRRYYNEAVIRSLCAPVYLGEGRLLCRVLGRYKMFVDHRDVGLSSHLLLDGYWEMWLTEALAEAVKPGMTAVDVGANLGYFTLLMADCVGAGGHVHAFEPNPRMVERLRQNVGVNGFGDRVVVHRQALSDGERAATLLVSEDEPKNGYVLPAAPGLEGEQLTTRRMDSFPELALAEVIKIDADMSEMAIWRGMGGLFEQTRPLTVFLEFSAARYPDPGAFLDEIVAAGFELSWLTFGEGVKPVERETILAEPPKDDLMLVLRR